MILVVDLNPYITKHYKTADFEANMINLVEKKITNSISVGTKASMLLKEFDKYPIFMSFSGGNNGRELKSFMDKRGINHNTIEIKDETSELLLIESDSRKIYLMNQYSRITRDELDKFYSEYSRVAREAEYICILGTKYDMESERFAENLVKIGESVNTNVGIVMDNRSNVNILDANPNLAIMSKSQLELVSGEKLEYEWEVAKQAGALVKKGIEVLGVVDSNRFVLYSEKHGYRVLFKDLDEKLSLDKSMMTVGFIIGRTRKYDFEMSTKLAIACGSTTVYDDENFDSAEIKKIMNSIVVEKFNI